MPDNTTIVKQVKGHLRDLAALCDTGYLLAVHIRYTRPSLMFTTYPANWLEHYGGTGMMMVDPVVRWAMSEDLTGGMALWRDLASDDPGQVVAAAAEYGLSNGMSFAVGPIVSRTIGSVTSSQPFSAEATARAEQLITAIHDLTEGLEQLPAETVDALRAIG
ncbi:MAG: autoinducer binding domain-containing protein [Paracoccaceae bacterium]